MPRATTASATRDPWDQEIGELLHELTTVQTEMLAVLNAKREAVGRGDLTAVEELRPRTEELIQRLQTCHDRRAQLLQRAANQGLPSKDITTLVSRVPGPPRDKLRKQVKESASRMRLLQQQSLANWVLAQRSLLHISQMLEIIATGGRLLTTYGRSETSVAGGTLVDQEA